MKLPALGAIAALTLSFATATMAADSDTQETISGAADSTVMTQTQDTKAVKKATKQNQADENKRGRPTANTSSATN
ncbi:hypothetical protein JN403_18735 [Pseudomonas sp. 15A4]|jgi:hypothetical protein|uniref:Secreted protein n=1 Tax=Pseudomonas graminis TaxID=158627 RepID=A0A6M8MRV0_9PSED|nr:MULTISPECIES: hypothetical protein [Pseudomonas]MDC6378794.1 hypothetical protein [Pseudomonas graminis]QKF52643.1 hypothetical protein FX982_03632 [Pseudomonas graminis]QSB18519.1 hypothetical protein JN403_18735 [Pseudomonas sp. 15A4]